MSIRELVGHRSTLVMYRDCLKVAPMMQPGNQAAILNIKKSFRAEFEKQKLVKAEQEHEAFRSGIVKMLSNFLAYEVVTQYKENPDKFSKTESIYEPDTDGEENDHEQKEKNSESKKKEPAAAEIDIDKLPFM